MDRRVLPSLLFVSAALFAGRFISTASAQQPGPTPPPAERPLRVVMVKTPFSHYRYRLATTPHAPFFAGFSVMVLTLSSVSRPPHSLAVENLAARIDYEDITLERGAIRDSEFTQWAAQPQERQTSRDMMLLDSGQGGSAHKLSGCVVTEIQPLPSPDGAAGSISINEIKLRCARVR
jgi:hypothetical protein